MISLGYIMLFVIGVLQSGSFDAFLQQLKNVPVERRNGAVHEFLASSENTPVVEPGGNVHFIWYGKARTVVLNGDLQRGWSVPDTMESVPCGDSSLFYRSYVVPLDARLDYQFGVDGKWGTDPRNPRITPSGYGPHSELAMPKFVSDPNLAARPKIQHGTLDSLVWKSKDDSLRQRMVKIYRPFGYEHLRDLPSLYVHDGFASLECEMFENLLDNLIADHTIKPVVVVFVPPVERELEYIARKQRAFGRALCEELVPLIDRTYGTSGKPEDRAMMGISNGGHVSLAIVLKRPDVFLNAAGQSSTITPQLFEILDNALEHLSSHKPFTIYTDVGQYDLDYPGSDASFLSTNREFSTELTKDRIKHSFHIFNDGHEWANWRERTGEILMMFFGVK